VEALASNRLVQRETCGREYVKEDGMRETCAEVCRNQTIIPIDDSACPQVTPEVFGRPQDCKATEALLEGTSLGLMVTRLRADGLNDFATDLVDDGGHDESGPSWFAVGTIPESKS
jgi:hypothetical protein